MRWNSLIAFIITFVAFPCVMFAQKHSNVYMKVDSIIRFDLKFNIESAIKAKVEPAKTNELIDRDAKGKPEFPVLMLDGKFIDMGILDSYEKNQIREFLVMKSAYFKTLVLFGSQNSAEAIFIYTKEYILPQNDEFFVL